MIEYHNPQAEVGAENTPYELSAVISGADSVSVGFLANGFPDSESFLDEVASAMQQLAPGIDPQRYNKGNATIPAPEAMLNDVRRDCDAVVAAYGH